MRGSASGPLISSGPGNKPTVKCFDCVRSRKTPICEAEIGHRSASLCHLGVIAVRLGRKLTWDPVKEAFVRDKEADGYLRREMRKPWTYEMI